MSLLDVMRAMLDESVGTRGSMRNCRAEKARRADAERQLDQLCDRIPPAATSGNGERDSA